MTVQEQHTLQALENFCSKANKRLSEIDWEQRRYEIAKEIFVSAPKCGTEWAEYSVRCANNLIEELKKQSNGI